MQYSRIAIKIGSNVLSTPEGTIDTERMSKLVDQITFLIKSGVEVVLISSGAVASGRSELKTDKKLDSVEQRQLFSAIGQTKLMNKYYKLFKQHGIIVGQVLTTKESFSTRRHYLNQRSCMKVMLDNGVLPIVNENDTISVSELMFTDNDELSGLIASMMDMEALIILSNIDGIFNGNPAEKGSKVIETIRPNEDLSQYIQTTKSSFGRGGMLTKTRIARKIAEEGIEVIIANGKKDDILINLLQKPKETLCTRFLPSEEQVSSVKKWIAHSEDFAKGEIHIDQRATTKLSEHQAASLLLVGVIAIKGEFEKDEIIKIISPDGETIGVGKSQYDSRTAKELMGTKGEKPIVHYDYLYMEK